jgi:AraC-like DNA-binding protein
VANSSTARRARPEQAGNPAGHRHVFKGELNVLATTPNKQLTRHPVLSTKDADEYCDRTSELFNTRYRFELPRGQAAIPGHVNLIEFGDVKVASSQLGGTARFVVDEFDCYMITMQLAGEMRIETDDGLARFLPAHAAVFHPQQSVQGSWGGQSLLLVHIKASALELELERILNRPVEAPVRFDLGMDLGTGMAQSWLATLRHLRRECDRPGGAMEHSIVADQFEHLLIDQLLFAQQHNYTEELYRPEPPAIPQVIHAAIDLIENSPENFFSASDVAAAVFISARALQDGFRRYVGIPPMAYLRKVRLARVHEELRVNSSDNVSVTEVACRWGFSHLGRFAADYRKRYGELPSETLRS